MIGIATTRMAISYRNELLVIGGLLVFIVLLPIAAVITITGTGVAAVSDSLVSVNVSAKLVDIRDPSGKLVTSLPISSTWPVGGVVTLEFGGFDPPWQVHHTGIDIADPRGKIGRPVTVLMEGTVSKVVNVDNKYGRHVFIDHGNNIISQYWHLSSASATLGARVTPGDVIGLEGSTGQSTGPHVHFEVQVYGIPTNPRLFIEGNPPSGL